jgi:phosphoribosylformylglycinamidine (FGAM) synthase-like amidotransferase family enzyme
MMPHPERATSDVLGNTDGREILKNLLMSEVLVG